MNIWHCKSLSLWIAITVALVPALCFPAHFVDLNNDGFTDLVGAGPDSVSVSLNDQNGSFIGQSYQVGLSPSSLCTADLDNDGYLDLAVVNAGSQSISVLMNLKDGSFADATSYATGNIVGKDICSFDVDLDGFTDLAILGESGRFIYFTGNGDGTLTFDWSQDADYIAGPVDYIFGADMDGDTDTDIGALGKLISIRYNDGGGTFDPNGFFYADVVSPVEFAVSDFTSDSLNDILILSGRSAALYTNDGYGGFEEDILWSPGSSDPPFWTTGKAIGDFNNDGIADIAWGWYFTTLTWGEPCRTGVGVSISDGSGAFVAWGGFSIDDVEYYVSGCGDFNGDGILDIYGGGGDYGIMYGLGDGTFQPGTATEVNGDGEHLSTPLEYSLSQNYPNPFNPATTFEYSLSEQSHVTIEVYNMLGQKVTTLVDGEEAAGSRTVTWDGTGANGSTAATGVYFYRIEAGEHVETKKMVLLK